MTPAFTVSQNPIVTERVTITDTSTSVTGTITKRRIFVSDSEGEYLTGNGTVDYDNWDLADAAITLDILTGDLAANILVQWLDVNNVVIETLNNNYPLSQFGKSFFFYLIQLQGLTPGVYQDSNYSGNVALFWSNLVGGDNAVTFGNDLSGAQNCYNRTNEMRTNESIYF